MPAALGLTVIPTRKRSWSSRYKS